MYPSQCQPLPLLKSISARPRPKDHMANKPAVQIAQLAPRLMTRQRSLADERRSSVVNNAGAASSSDDDFVRRFLSRLGRQVMIEGPSISTHFPTSCRAPLDRLAYMQVLTSQSAYNTAGTGDMHIDPHQRFSHHACACQHMRAPGAADAHMLTHACRCGRRWPAGSCTCGSRSSRPARPTCCSSSMLCSGLEG